MTNKSAVLALAIGLSLPLSSPPGHAAALAASEAPAPRPSGSAKEVRREDRQQLATDRRQVESRSRAGEQVGAGAPCGGRSARRAAGPASGARGARRGGCYDGSVPAHLIYEGQRIELGTQLTIIGRRPPEMTLEPEEPRAYPSRPAVQPLDDGRTVVAVRDMRLARRHFEIRREDTPEGAVRYFVRDLDSHCGTPINGRRVDAGWHELADGDLLLFEMFRFRCAP